MSFRVREILRLQEQPVWLHEVFYGQTTPPRCPHGGMVPPTDLVCHCFTEPFDEGSSRTPSDLTPTARVLDAIMRRTLLLRMGYRKGLTRIQLWLLNSLMQQTMFDIWDLLLFLSGYAPLLLRKCTLEMDFVAPIVLKLCMIQSHMRWQGSWFWWWSPYWRADREWCCDTETHLSRPPRSKSSRVQRSFSFLSGVCRRTWWWALFVILEEKSS